MPSPASPPEFLDLLFGEFYSLMHAFVPDNYDEERFSADGVDRARVFERATHTRNMRYVIAEHVGLFESWLSLADEVSRERFLRLLLFRLLGHHHVRINPAETAETELALYAKARAMGRPSDLALNGAFGALSHFEGVPLGEHRLALDCWAGGVVYPFLKDQYFFRRDQIVIQPEPGDVVLDAGCCLGDTTAAFAATVGSGGRVYAFDPISDHLVATRHNAAQNGLADRVETIPYAISDRFAEGVLRSSEVDPGFSLLRSGSEGLPLMSIDHFAASRGLERLNFIKMDIEGSEEAALRGAEQSLRRFRPKLAISLYHRISDYVAIPRRIRSMLPDYELFLEHYSMHAEETVLYARPRR